MASSSNSSQFTGELLAILVDVGCTVSDHARVVCFVESIKHPLKREEVWRETVASAVKPAPLAKTKPHEFTPGEPRVHES
jgi:enamine deaminase RidA (YjgF/YER057c/UK114 family)